MTDHEDNVPFIKPEQNPPEFTWVAVIVGIALAVIFCAANAYLGLRVGMTVSASIPAAVISMAVLRILLRRQSVLENNLVQTIASAGESLAAGVIFTLPAFFLWQKEGVAKAPSIAGITIMALVGGVLGVLFMIPLRRYLIVKEDKTLLFPEGRACAQVLLSAESQAGKSRHIFLGGFFGMAVKFVLDGLKVCASTISLPIRGLHTAISAEAYPALLGVGYICGLRISGMLLCGSILSWLVLMPLIAHFGGNIVNEATGLTIDELYLKEGPRAIWSHYIRYIGAGAVAAGGLLGLIKSLPAILGSFASTIKGLRSGGGAMATGQRTDRDLSPKVIFSLIGLLFLLLVLAPEIPLNFAGVLLFMLCGFFFAVVASRIAGVVGSSNSPCSGMTIAALLISACVLKASGVTGANGMVASLAIATMCCVITAIAGDTSQDLKTGFLLGATPSRQQLGEIIGVVATSLCIAGIILLLDKAWGFGSHELPAPQAHLMKLVCEGVMHDSMAWSLVLTGAAISLAMECLGVSSLCVAIGVFLPMNNNVTIFLGGLTRFLVEKKAGSVSENGVLMSSGFIAGEGVLGILLALLTVLNLDCLFDISKTVTLGFWGPATVLVATMLLLFLSCRCKNGKAN